MILDNGFEIEKMEEEIVDDNDSDSESDDSDVSMSSGVSDTDDESPETADGNGDEEEEDDLVKAINNSKEIHREHPPAIEVDDFIVTVCFHPNNDVIALGSVEGDVQVYKYNNQETILSSTIELHEKACRDLKFSADGNTLYSVSKDKSIMITDFETEKLKRNYDNSHESPIYSTTVVDENIFATGDDSGIVKLWDLRQKGDKPIFSVNEMNDFVSSMITNSDKKYLVCSCGDGSLTTINMTARKLHVQSEEYDEEFTCLGLFKEDTKILAACNTGKMYIFNWGEFGLHSDEFPNLTKKSINCMIPITENIVVTGGEDGILRAYGLFPHRKLGIVGQHEYSVESIDISNDGTIIASSSHDNLIKFWNVKYFETLNVQEQIKGGKQKQMKYNLPSSKVNNASDFFSDLV